jgi:hypothetical protein
VGREGSWQRTVDSGQWTVEGSVVSGQCALRAGGQ